MRPRLEIKSQMYCFLGSASVSDNDLIQAVEDGRFYGVLKVDIFSPDDVIAELKHLNFPVIFRFVRLEFFSNSNVAFIEKSVLKSLCLIRQF